MVQDIIWKADCLSAYVSLVEEFWGFSLDTRHILLTFA
jgi:hypothetical protein